jgi:hypothetical protein
VSIDYSKVVKVSLLEDRLLPEDERRFIRVEVYATRKRLMFGLLKKQRDIFPRDCYSMDQFRRQVEVSAGAMAEMLCEQYKDRLDPAECARMAKEKFAVIERAMQTRPAPHQERGLDIPQ